MYAFIALPGIVSIGFNFISPFSIFRRMMIVSCFFGTFASFAFSLKAELIELGKVDESPIGQEIRYRYSQLAAFDKLQMSFKEQIKTME
jgi:hypothetical protein